MAHLEETRTIAPPKVRRFINGALSAGSVALVATFTMQAISTAGIDGKMLAYTYLTLAFFAAVVGTIALETLWGMGLRRRIIIIVGAITVEAAAFIWLAHNISQSDYPAPPTANANLAIQRVEALPPGPRRDTLDVRFRLQNTGAASAWGFRRVTAVASRSKELTIEEIDKLFANMNERILTIPPASTNEIRPGEELSVNLIGTQGPKGFPDKSAWESQSKGITRVYTAIVYNFNDEMTPKGTMNSVENCVFWSNDVATTCPAHNRLVRAEDR